jgi:general secretion pathway protein G
MKRRSPRGMTLIEIIVVIAILTSLMAAVGVYALGVHIDSMRKIARTDTKSAAAALDVFRAMRGRYPSAAEGFAPVLEIKALKESPRDPWGNELVFVIENGEPVVISYGADGRPGGTEADADITSRDRG